MQNMTQEERDELIIQLRTHAQRISEIVLRMQLLKMQMQANSPANQNGEQ